MSEHILGIRKQPNGGWATGVVHARVRHGKAALELRGTHYHATLRIALESFATPARLNGHAGVASSLLGGTAGLTESAVVIQRILSDPGGALRVVWQSTGITQREWARRAGVSVRTVQRVTHPDPYQRQVPSSRTVRRMLEALQ